MEAVGADIVARVTLFPSSEGGRRGATPREMFACIFEYEGESFDCRLLLGKVGPLSPGSETLVPIKFVRPDLVKSRLGCGARFTLREISVIGDGEVREVLTS